MNPMLGLYLVSLMELFQNEFHRIENCTYAKEAWDICPINHKGTSTVKVCKLQMLITMFENIRMHENQNFLHFILNWLI